MSPDIMFFVFLIVLACLVTFVKLVRMKQEARPPGPGAADYEQLAARVQRLEGRVANIETIVVDHDKRRKFDDAGGGGALLER